MIPVEVGRVFQAVAATQPSPSLGSRNSEVKRPLWFFHETKHFAHGIVRPILSVRMPLLIFSLLQNRILAFRVSRSLEIFLGNLVTTKAQRRCG